MYWSVGIVFTLKKREVGVGNVTMSHGMQEKCRGHQVPNLDFKSSLLCDNRVKGGVHERTETTFLFGSSVIGTS